MLLFPNENRIMIHAYYDNRVEEHNNNKTNRYRLIPLITNRSIDMEQVLNNIIGNSNEDDMEANNYQSANGEVGDEREFICV